MTDEEYQERVNTLILECREKIDRLKTQLASDLLKLYQETVKDRGEPKKDLD